VIEDIPERTNGVRWVVSTEGAAGKLLRSGDIEGSPENPR